MTMADICRKHGLQTEHVRGLLDLVDAAFESERQTATMERLAFLFEVNAALTRMFTPPAKKERKPRAKGPQAVPVA